MFKEYNPKAIKYTNTEIVMCLMKEVGERVTKKRKILVPWEEQAMHALQF